MFHGAIELRMPAFRPFEYGSDGVVFTALFSRFFAVHYRTLPVNTEWVICFFFLCISCFIRQSKPGALIEISRYVHDVSLSFVPISGLEPADLGSKSDVEPKQISMVSETYWVRTEK
jgi:hypothetical protein